MEELIGEVEGKQIELEKAQFELERAKEKLKTFIGVNPDISFKGSGNTHIDFLIEQYQKQFKP